MALGLRLRNMAVSPFRGSTSIGSTGARSRDFDLADARHGGALGDVGGQQAGGPLFGWGGGGPPDGVTAGAAGGERCLVAKRALVSLEGCEDDPALIGVVAVLEQITGHGSEVAAPRPRRHRAPPGPRPLICRARDVDLSWPERSDGLPCRAPRWACR